ncbi:hypothetical protein TNIN_390441 [Trichonephila inaurata madagascariensis]|uniref:Uncharacterized protein n=1 Tax=Trichonephila inaurata madagascariensis TaxID=2747483 RepID=A0A8X6MB19_9ARAC|nr:hypothetical protein TNIN_390441 [Trichonephila inaurata madagascariensis]
MPAHQKCQFLVLVKQKLDRDQKWGRISFREESVFKLILEAYTSRESLKTRNKVSNIIERDCLGGVELLFGKISFLVLVLDFTFYKKES